MLTHGSPLSTELKKVYVNIISLSYIMVKAIFPKHMTFPTETKRSFITPTLSGVPKPLIEIKFKYFFCKLCIITDIRGARRTTRKLDLSGEE